MVRHPFAAKFGDRSLGTWHDRTGYIPLWSQKWQGVPSGSHEVCISKPRRSPTTTPLKPPGFMHDVLLLHFKRKRAKPPAQFPQTRAQKKANNLDSPRPVNLVRQKMPSSHMTALVPKILGCGFVSCFSLVQNKAQRNAAILWINPVPKPTQNRAGPGHVCAVDVVFLAPGRPKVWIVRLVSLETSPKQAATRPPTPGT